MLNTNEFPKKAGRIFPPLVNIEYGVVTPEDVEEGIEMDFEFKVSYKMEMREARKDIEVLFSFTNSHNLSFIVSISKKNFTNFCFFSDCHGSFERICTIMVCNGNLVLVKKIWKIWDRSLHIVQIDYEYLWKFS